jgi:hypothetical protein
MLWVTEGPDDTRSGVYLSTPQAIADLLNPQVEAVIRL